MNPDGSANTQWLKTYAKYFAFHKRLVRLDNIEDTESIHLGGYTYFDTTLGPIGGIDDRWG